MTKTKRRIVHSNKQKGESMLGAMTQQETQYVTALKKQAEDQIAQLLRERQSLANKNAILQAQFNTNLFTGTSTPTKEGGKVVEVAKMSTPAMIGLFIVGIIWYMSKKR
jgi:hypothetical protein